MLHCSKVLEHRIGGTPAGHQAMNLPKTTRKMSLCVGVETCPELSRCAFSNPCLTLLSVCACLCTCFCACQSVSWGKIISSVLSGSPRGLLGFWALLEPACREADMTAVLENEAKRIITPRASVFILQHGGSTYVVYMKWRTHIAQPTKAHSLD